MVKLRHKLCFFVIGMLTRLCCLRLGICTLYFLVLLLKDGMDDPHVLII